MSWGDLDDLITHHQLIHLNAHHLKPTYTLLLLIVVDVSHQHKVKGCPRHNHWEANLLMRSHPCNNQYRKKMNLAILDWWSINTEKKENCRKIANKKWNKRLKQWLAHKGSRMYLDHILKWSLDAIHISPLAKWVILRIEWFCYLKAFCNSNYNHFWPHIL